VNFFDLLKTKKGFDREETQESHEKLSAEQLSVRCISPRQKVPYALFAVIASRFFPTEISLEFALTADIDGCSRLFADKPYGEGAGGRKSTIMKEELRKRTLRRNRRGEMKMLNAQS
jgi:hypothetical protein